MNKDASVNIRVNSEVKEQAEKILSTMGITLSESVNMFLHQINLKKRIPFEINTKKDYTMADFNQRVRDNIAKYERGEGKLNGPYDNLEDLWKELDI